MLARVRSVAPVEFINRPLYHAERSSHSLTRRNPRKTAAAKLLILYAEANKRRMRLDAKWTRTGIVSRLVARPIRAARHAWSIVIISHEGANLLKHSLRSWLESDAFKGADVEFIVVDDGSPQPLSEKINADCAKIRFIRLSDRRGSAYARHVGASNAKNPMIFFADGDQIVPPDVLGSHERRHSLCAKPSVIVGGMFGRKVATSVDPVGVPVRLFRKLLEQIRFDRQRLLRLAEAAVFGGVAELLKDKDQNLLWDSVEPFSFADPYLAGWLPDALAHGDVAKGPFAFMRLRSATLSMSMDTYQKIGGFDPAIPAIEDWEFGFRCQMLGIPIVSAPEIEAYHQLHPTDTRRTQLTRAALPYFRQKHGEAFESLVSQRGSHYVPGLSVMRDRAGHQIASQRTERADLKRRFMVLTFDDSPHPVCTSHLLKLLQSTEARATFFVMGSSADRHRAIMREIVEAGCEIGIHGWDHTPVVEQTSAEIGADLKRAAAAIFDTVGVFPRFCRPPHDRASAGYLNAAAKLGLSLVGRNVSPSIGKTPSFTEVIVELATKQLLGKTISLPDGTADPEVTIQVLDWLLECARRNNVAVLSAAKAQTLVTFPTPTVVNFAI
jgi:peptidoglycan/xylan/chitin deacetylase (PgdA/CDA1 family)